MVGWWPSHPAEPINGVMVSDHYHTQPPGKPGDSWNLRPTSFTPDKFERTARTASASPGDRPGTHPAIYPHGAEVDQEKDPRIVHVMKIIAECTQRPCLRHRICWKHEPWDFAGVYYDAIDHFSHGFMRYHPPATGDVSEQDFRLYKNVVSAGYVYHDMMLGTTAGVGRRRYHSDRDFRPWISPRPPASQPHPS